MEGITIEHGISRMFVKKSNFAKWGLCSIEYTRFSIEKVTYYGLLPDLKFKMLRVDEIIFMVTPPSLAFPNEKDESVPLLGLRKYVVKTSTSQTNQNGMW